MINGIVSIPHLNIRGRVSNKSGDDYKVLLSKKSQSFLNTSSIEINVPNPSISLNTDDEIFVKFNQVYIKGKSLFFNSIEIYKYFDTIEKEEIGHVIWYVLNDFGGIFSISGTEFIYNGIKYVDNDKCLSDDEKQYFVDIYDKKLLYEDYKNIFPPMKWYNMVNPQETMFDIIVNIYKGDI